MILLKLRASFFALVLAGSLTSPVPWPSYVVVDKSEHTLTYYSFSIPVITFSVGTGRKEEDTPTGTFPIVMLVKNPWYLKKNIPGGDPENPLGSRWIGLEVPGTDGSKYGIHGTNQPDSIGENRSAGCIRMRNQDVNWLYRYVRIGTLVKIAP
ncbi:L,D-transpeptidase [Effusibacillus consociatus]|uniref:L,D-transpeptidase n=1 Tax=Effusibacillus consociatus TaxID=1117041 RepID=A0ABV9QAI1_9BACL